MAKKTYYNISFSAREETTGDDILNVNVHWENPSEQENIKNINKWLTMIDSNLVVTSKNSN